MGYHRYDMPLYWIELFHTNPGCLCFSELFKICESSVLIYLSVQNCFSCPVIDNGESLKFNSKFESGNLRKAIQVRKYVQNKHFCCCMNVLFIKWRSCFLFFHSVYCLFLLAGLSMTWSWTLISIVITITSGSISRWAICVPEFVIDSI